MMAVLMLAVVCTPPACAQPDANGIVAGRPASLADGIYQGTTERLTGANEHHCSDSGPISIEVTGGRFKLPWRPLQTFDARIDAHGGFSATTANQFAAADKHMTIVPVLQGHVVEGRIIGEYGTRWCSYRFEAVKQ